MSLFVTGHPAVPTSEAARKAAQWALDNGHNVDTQDANTIDQLPTEPFVIRRFSFVSNEKRSTPGASNIEGARAVTELTGAGRTDADSVAQHIGKLKSLVYLSLESSDLSATGLERLKRLSELEELRLIGCSNLSDDALAHLSAFQHLGSLDLSSTLISDDGLAHLAGLKKTTESARIHEHHGVRTQTRGRPVEAQGTPPR